MPLSEKVNQLRRSLKLTQRQLADKTSITQATLSRIEKGKVQNLRVSTLVKLASALNTTVDYLTDKTNEISLPDLILSDPNAQLLWISFKKLSLISQNELVKYAKYLVAQQNNRDEGGTS
jgi:transcriptional regulator with XRE-family HTH domain